MLHELLEKSLYFCDPGFFQTLPNAILSRIGIVCQGQMPNGLRVQPQITDMSLTGRIHNKEAWLWSMTDQIFARFLEERHLEADVKKDNAPTTSAPWLSTKHSTFQAYFPGSRICLLLWKTMGKASAFARVLPASMESECY